MKKYIFHLLWNLGHKKDVCFVSGSPRSGTTWVMEVIQKVTKARLHWEPLNWFLYDRDYDRTLDELHWMRPDYDLISNCTEISGEITSILSNCPPRKIHQAKIGHINIFSNLFRIVNSQATLIKFVFSQRALAWIAKYESALGCVLIRHPAAVVASQLHHPYKINGASITHPEWTEEVISRTHPMIASNDLDRWPVLDKLIDKCESKVEKLAITACIDVLHVVTSKAALDKYPIVIYESLLESPELFEQLVGELGMKVKKKPSLEMLSGRSRTTSDLNGNQGADRLTPSERAKIQAIINSLGLDCFSFDGSVNVDWFRALGCKVIG